MTEGAVRVGPLVALPALLRSFGADPDTVFREAGVDPRLLDNPENSIGFVALGRLLALSAARTGCAHLGLLLGQRGGLEATGAGDLVVQVRRVLHNLLLDGRGTLGQVAELFELHRRTLNRRMREQGLTVKRLIDEVRYEIARQLLSETDLSVMELATVLGYADATAFTRAFRRWSGTGPAAWRAARRV